ncbi:vesicle-fusing ATPase-like isoform X2 [Zophobas morio]
MDLEKLKNSMEDGSHSEVGEPSDLGVLMSQTAVDFVKAEGSAIKIKGTAAGICAVNLINPDWNFEQMGIGGLDKEFRTIFRRAFASRVFPPDLVAQLGIQHVRGILLYGPPGCGKTLMARQIGKMLNARPPKIVNGPDILNKYVGQSEENIRKLFSDAEKEAAEHGDYSALHIIIFDEIDAICRQRGMSLGSTSVSDNIVNQLLAKIDGYERLNNVLIIGMTNRADLIDSALLRPGRLEVQMEIGLPDEKGRLQILSIHTQSIRDNGLLSPDVSLEELAALSKNYSGAEIEGVIKAASSYAFYRHVDNKEFGKVDVESLKHMKLYRADFVSAFEDVTPSFGVQEADFKDCTQNGIVTWDSDIEHIIEEGRLYCNQVQNSSRTRLVSLLIDGLPGAGKTALAATIALNSGYPFIKLVSPEQYVGMSEASKCGAITKTFEDAYKSPLSLIVIDNIERLLDYVPIGPRFSNMVLQTLLVLIKKQPKQHRRLFVIGTTSQRGTMVDLGVLQEFDAHATVPCLSLPEHVASVVKEINLFEGSEISRLAQLLRAEQLNFRLGVKPLIMICEMVRQDPQMSAETFLMYFREEVIKLQYA